MQWHWRVVHILLIISREQVGRRAHELRGFDGWEFVGL